MPYPNMAFARFVNKHVEEQAGRSFRYLDTAITSRKGQSK